MIVVTDFRGNNGSNFELLWSCLEWDYSSSSDTACGKKENRVDLYREGKEDHTFFEILAPI